MSHNSSRASDDFFMHGHLKAKKKASRAERSQPSILLEYIRSNTSKETSTTKTTPSTTPPNQLQIIFPNTSELVSAYNFFTFSSSTTRLMEGEMLAMQNYADISYGHQLARESALENAFHVKDFQEPHMLESLEFIGIDGGDDEFMGMHALLQNQTIMMVSSGACMYNHHNRKAYSGMLYQLPK